MKRYSPCIDGEYQGISMCENHDGKYVLATEAEQLQRERDEAVGLLKEIDLLFNFSEPISETTPLSEADTPRSRGDINECFLAARAFLSRMEVKP